MHADFFFFFPFTDEIWPVLPHGLACIDYGALNVYLNIFFNIYANESNQLFCGPSAVTCFDAFG